MNAKAMLKDWATGVHEQPIEAGPTIASMSHSAYPFECLDHSPRLAGTGP